MFCLTVLHLVYLYVVWNLTRDTQLLHQDSQGSYQPFRSSNAWVVLSILGQIPGLLWTCGLLIKLTFSR
jgi:hypothetical protein